MAGDEVEPAADAAVWTRVRALVDEARVLPPGERRAHVEAHAEDALMVARVLRLLDLDDPTTERRAGEVVTAVVEGIGPERLGPWELRQRVGRGGMADVWLAARADGAYRRRVAIKRLHPGLATPEVVRRFEREKQILANLSHPGIAKMLEAGADAEGTPYLVMEYVDGQRLDEYADERHLDVRARVELVARIADAAMTAHRLHVVHRDIKPSNVLVDLEGHPTLLDFGIAKVLDPEKDAEALVTRDVNRFMTPSYASPEQVDGRALVATSDVYSLGAVLYELLTGAPPLDVTGRSAADAAEIVRTREPERLATAVARAADPDEIARRRGTTKARLVKELADRDLDAVVMAALRKEPARRPPDAGAFRDELQRWLAGSPVHSRRDTWLRRARRVVARNRAVTALAALFVIALVGGLAISIAEARRANEANARLAAETRLAQQRLETLRDSTRVLVQDAVETLGGIPGAQHALDRLIRMGIAIARREDDPRMRQMLGRAIVHKARIDSDRRGTGPHVLDAMREGIALAEAGRDAMGRAPNPDLPHMRMELAMELLLNGELAEIDAVLDAAYDDSTLLVPTSATNRADLVAMRARIESRRASTLVARGEFAAAEETVEATLDTIAKARREIPGLAEGSSEDAGLHSGRDRARMEFVRGALLAIEARLRNSRAGIQLSTSNPGASVEAQRTASLADYLAESHGDNVMLASAQASLSLRAAETALVRGDLEGADGYLERAREVLDGLGGEADAESVWIRFEYDWLRTQAAHASGDRARSEELVTRFALEIEGLEDKLARSFSRDRTIALATDFLGSLAHADGQLLEASARYSGAYEAFDDLARRSPAHFHVAVERARCAYSLHRLFEEEGGAAAETSAKWLERAREHWDDLPGDELAHSSWAWLGDAIRDTE